MCESEQCFQATNICHKTYFREMHFDTVGNKKTTHKSVPFDESHQFRNFYAIAKLEAEITRKLAQALRGIPANLDALLQTALYSSDLFLEIFNNSTEAIA